MKKIFYIYVFMAIVMVAMSFSNKRSKINTDLPLKISFHHFVGNEILKLDSIFYKNELGQTFTVSKFKYYISNLHLKNSNNKDFFINESFLIDEDDENTKHLILKQIPEGNYIAIDFIIGVDSVHNCSGAQSGALDPINAMFWAWNTGYIFLKLEGKSSFSKSPGNFFEYHIGGYKQPNNCIRKINLELNKEIVKINSKKETTLNIKVDILELLKTPTTIDFTKLSSVTDFHNATTVADNYVDMFDVIETDVLNKSSKSKE